jgi:hypothetical protein
MKIKLDGTVLELKEGQYISEDGEVVLSLDEAEQSILDGKAEILNEAEAPVVEADKDEDDEDDDSDEDTQTTNESEEILDGLLNLNSIYDPESEEMLAVAFNKDILIARDDISKSGKIKFTELVVNGKNVGENGREVFKTTKQLETSTGGAVVDYNGLIKKYSVVGTFSSKMIKSMNEAVELSFTDINVETDINEMFGETDFSDEFKSKAGVIYEAAVKSTIRAHVEKLEEQYVAKVAALETEHEEKLETAVSEGLEDISNDLNSYLDYIAEEWMEENKLAVEAGVKTEITEGFITGMKTLFTEAYVEIPEEKRDVLAEQADKIEALESKLNEEMNRKIEMKGQLREANRKAVFDQVSEDLSDMEKSRLETLSADLTYETNEDYKVKLDVLVEKYFNDVNESKESDTPAVEPELSEEEKGESHDESISAYMSAISKSSK